jgi:hypothetical protein
MLTVSVSVSVSDQKNVVTTRDVPAVAVVRAADAGALAR